MTLSTQGTQPWHMWGQARALNLTSGGTITFGAPTTGQIAKVSYKRPDSFSFLLGAELLTGIGPGGSPISPGNVKVSFAVTVGVGLSNIILDPFSIPLVFQWTAFAPAKKWFTVALSPVLDDQASTPQRVSSDIIVAQNIQVSATGTLTTSTNGDTCVVQAHAYFAPRVHVRADWFGLKPLFFGERD
jgi:hypothetical protein